METTGQTMGLDETLNELEATSEENGIDVHMMLPTEYGAVAILSASGYGNPGKLQDEADVQKRTTTGNSTGVYFTGDRWEIVACFGSDKYSRIWSREGGSIEFFAGQSGWHGGMFNSTLTIRASDGSQVTMRAEGSDPTQYSNFVLVCGSGLFSAGSMSDRPANRLQHWYNDLLKYWSRGTAL